MTFQWHSSHSVKSLDADQHPSMATPRSGRPAIYSIHWDTISNVQKIGWNKNGLTRLKNAKFTKICKILDLQINDSDLCARRSSRREHFENAGIDKNHFKSHHYLITQRLRVRVVLLLDRRAHRKLRFAKIGHIGLSDDRDAKWE